MDTLKAIQSELKVPKGNYNDYGRYSYRNCEDILEAVKPLCAKHDCVLTLTDRILVIGERYYVEATATLKTPRNVFETKACAREEEKKKGMDASQITGAASSYARKYALNGLFCIDDTKDADASKAENRKVDDTDGGSNKINTITEFQVDEVVSILDKHHKSVEDMCKYFKVNSVEELTMAQYHEVKKIFKEK